MKNIGILGSGVVAKALGAGFLKHGYSVKLGTRDTAKLEDWIASEGSGATLGSFPDTANFGDIVVLAVKGTAAESALHLAGQENFAGKTIIDATNPIEDAPPQDGVLKFFTDQNDSLLERIQTSFPDANIVKAFNSVSSIKMVNPSYGLKPTMFICGNSEPAKKEVVEILDQFGWDPEDMGSAKAARAIEPLCMLYCILGFNKGQWSHAFKLLKEQA